MDELKEKEVLDKSVELQTQIEKNKDIIDNLEIEARKRPPAKDAEKIQKAIREQQNKMVQPPKLMSEYNEEEIKILLDKYNRAFNGEKVDTCYFESLIPLETILKSSQKLITVVIDHTLRKGTVEIKFKNIDEERLSLVSQGIIKYICDSTELMYSHVLALSETQGINTDNIFKVELYATSFVKALFNTLLLLDNREFYTRTAGYKKIRDFMCQLVDLVRAVRTNENDEKQLKEINDFVAKELSKYSQDELTPEKLTEIKEVVFKDKPNIEIKTLFNNILHNWSSTTLKTNQEYNKELLDEAKSKEYKKIDKTF